VELYQFFFPGSVDTWNALPPAFRSTPSPISAFKHGLKQTDLSAYFEDSAIKKEFFSMNV
jgi:hypothetical protein